MRCSKCKRDDVATLVITDVWLKDQHHGLFWWLFVGWWWVPIKWTVFTIPALLVKIFGHKKKKVIRRQRTVYVRRGRP